METTKSSIQEEALEAILPYKRCGAHVSPGMGKTLLGLNYLTKNYTDYCKFLVVAPKKSIFQSWIDDAEKFGLQHLLPHITFTTYLSLDKQNTDFDIIILDECHSLLFSVDFWLNNYHGKILGLSGTFPKHKSSEKGKMVDKYCPAVYTYDTDSAVEDEILNDYEIRIHTLPLDTNKTILIKKPDKQWYTSEQDIYNYWTKRIDEATTAQSLQISRIMRMKAMMEFPSKEILAKKLMNSITKKCIIFANTTEQCERLCKFTYHSKNPDSDKNLEMFKTGEIMQLGAVLQLSEGINVPDLEESLILHSYGNERKSAQRLSRTLRLNPNMKSINHILCYTGCIDSKWTVDSLSNFDQTKINYL